MECTCENGHCITDSEGIAQCTCPPEFGKYTITLCAACKCGKGANCTFDPGFFTGDGKKCVCPFDFKESDGICEDACTNAPCKNGGICQPMGKTFNFTCKKSY
ncbi:hypothetical protein JTE90_026419 [Oedothorax gibbosus]|uniref:EGF-like domain-containing protein n=1 Tax=Oedothorax gibbosus TaxID=931172 RepID=A0AAV6TK48_9ARAC|nr:hypothetical protein JTE90_026419 [Oedothorax gibbosus]